VAVDGAIERRTLLRDRHWLICPPDHASGPTPSLPPRATFASACCPNWARRSATTCCARAPRRCRT
jgi:hypothetical protein